MSEHNSELKKLLVEKGWAENEHGRWHRTAQHPDTGVDIYHAHNSVGGLDVLDRETLEEAGWILSDDETWNHPGLSSKKGLSGKKAMEVHRLAELQAVERDLNDSHLLAQKLLEAGAY